MSDDATRAIEQQRVSSPQQQVSLEERLSHLHSLHLNGGLTASEFAAAKSQVLQQPSAASGFTLPTRGQPYLVTSFGAAGDGITDDTHAIQAAVDAALAPEGPALVQFPPGVYMISDTINATGSAGNQSFSPCSFAGQSVPQRSILRMMSQPHRGASADAPLPLIQFRGGSGAISHAYVERLTLAGQQAEDFVAGIHFAGMDGVVARQCIFTNLTIGAWFFNQDAGAFTEYCQVHDSQFTATVLTALKYQRSPVCPTAVYPCKGKPPCSGSCNASVTTLRLQSSCMTCRCWTQWLVYRDTLQIAMDNPARFRPSSRVWQLQGSFHGSGMQRCVANWSGKAPFIWVASPGVVYNAPWDFQV